MEKAQTSNSPGCEGWKWYNV